MPIITKPKLRKKQSGSSMLETLIALMIFSVGILALMAMQGRGIRASTDASYRAEAAFLASEIMYQMWVDRANISSYQTSGGAYTNRDCWIQRVGQRLPGTASATGACAAAATAILAGTVKPSITVAAGVVTVTVQWKRPDETAAHSYVTTTEINPRTGNTP